MKLHIHILLLSFMFPFSINAEDKKAERYIKEAKENIEKHNLTEAERLLQLAKSCKLDKEKKDWVLAKIITIKTKIKTGVKESLPTKKIEQKTEGNKKPSWASEFGIDKHGIWAKFKIGKNYISFRKIIRGKMSIDNHEILIQKDFWITETPCTTAVANAIDQKPSPEKKDYPQTNLSPKEIENKISTLNTFFVNKKTIARLPNINEWEYATMAGAYKNYDKNFSTKKDGNFDSIKLQRTRLFFKNNFGLYDIHGCLWELCKEEKKSKNSSFFVRKGGSWISSYKHCALSFTAPLLKSMGENKKDETLGFRILIEDEE